MSRICVYCSSSNAIDPIFLEAAKALGRMMGERGDQLVYGGANVGAMGALADSLHAMGGHVTGIIPEYLAERGLDFKDADELLIVPTMSERKMEMAARSDAFIILPGGFGTLEELLEILTLKQLHYHNKAVVLVNIGGFYGPLLALFQDLVDRQFTKAENLELYQVVDNVEAALAAVDSYIPPAGVAKWL